MNLQRYSIKILFTLLTFILCLNNIYSQIEKVHPPNWWIGFENQNLQLLVKANDISEYKVEINSPGITLIDIHEADSPNYLFLDLKISDSKEEILLYREAIVRHSAKPIDTSYLSYKKLIGFEKSSILAKELGFGGKACIHPNQIEIANRIF